MRQKDREPFKNIMNFMAGVILVACFTAAFAYAWTNSLNPILARPFENKGNLLMFAVYALILFLFMRVLGGFKIGVYKRASVILSQVIALFCTNAIIFVQATLMVGYIRKMNVIGLSLGKVFLAQAVCSVVLIFAETAVFQMIFPPKRMLVLYETRTVRHIIEKISTREDKYVIAKTIKVDENWENALAQENDYDAVLIYDISSKYRNDVLKYCYSNSIRTYLIPKISDIIIRSADELQIFDTPILLSRNYTLSAEQRFIKRFIDIVISLAGIIICSPIIIVTAILIKLYDKGPVFYKQKRCTINNKVFEIYKFRSMIVDAEKDGEARLATAKDSRITPIGNFIRKTRIDEIPQFFNILKGDMSFVGPRPERPEIIAEYCKSFPEFEYRTRVKAGLTGYAQVYGKYNTTSYDKLKWDLMYIQKYSIGLDLKLIIMTIKIVFMKESTEGLSEGKKIANSNDEE